MDQMGKLVLTLGMLAALAAPAAADTAEADALVAGAKVAPDRKRAAAMYREACGLPAAGAAADAAPAETGDFTACMALAELTGTGWLFEVERDPALHAVLVERAHDLAAPHCTEADTSGCAVAARAARERRVMAPATADAAAAAKYAERGCTVGRDREACRVVGELAASADKQAEAVRLQAVARAGLAEACIKDGVAAACLEAGLSDGKVRSATEKLCTKGETLACVAVSFQGLIDNRKHAAAARPFAVQMIAACGGDGHPLCAALAERLIRGNARFGIEADPPTGIGIAERRCTAGDREGCKVLAESYGAKGPEGVRDAAKAKTFADRTCELTAPEKKCRECDADPTLASCVRRAAFAEHERCYAGEVGACERIGARFRDGAGVTADVATAARYLRRGCDGAEKPACIALDAVCIANPALPDEVCQQALIHTDLFYEAEYQLEERGEAGLVDPDAAAAEAGAPGGTVAMAAEAAPGGAGIQLKRGSLDADLVVDIVLDRARQAAIELVVDELVGAGKHARYRYLSDLLAQGSRLLADPSTLRREKFQDLGMTVVRAFVASNLVDTMIPTGTELVAAPVIGPTVRGQLGVEPGAPLPPPVHGYLVDVAYRWLGETRLFGRGADATADTPPPCPWSDGAGATLCVQLAERATVEKALHVDRILDGLRLAKGLRAAGFDELRRLIEAVSKSRSIASFSTTPGLNLAAWRSVLVAGSREKVAVLRARLTDLRALTQEAAYRDNGAALATLAQRATATRALLDSRAIRIVLGHGHASHLMRIVGAIEKSAPKDAAGAAEAAPATADVLDRLRKAVLAELTAWGPRELGELTAKVGVVEANLDGLAPALDKLENAIVDIEALFGRFPRPDGSVVLDVSVLPLYAINDLARDLRAAGAALGTIETQMRSIFPGEVQASLQFARSATARLLGFLDLMERIARTSPLTQTCGDIVAAIGSLGSSKRSEFTAPLYDVLEPVLDAIKTHEPMSLDLLFQVIARVRLDTLVGSLQAGGNPCKHDGGVDCWTVKLIHALQESVERDGDLIRVDGGKFAQRLARQGDDFRRKHTWRGYFHLTVGFGAMRSEPVGDTATPADAAMRTVPLVSEQIGFGWASPAFWGNHVTFKFGAAASGLLYRAVLDSKESEAIMVHPLFLAVDIGDLIEAYVSPAMILVYPPTDERDTTVRWGIAAGLSVPLSSYLEKL
jgi:TPR repeat protein